MEDFNRISFVTRNFKLLNGLLLLPLAFMYTGQILSSLGLSSTYLQYFPLILLCTIVLPLILFLLMNQFYKKRFGTVTSFKAKNAFGKGFATYTASLAIVTGAAFVSVKLTSLLIGLFFVGISLFMPNFKENWLYRRHTFAVAAGLFAFNLVPLENIIYFKYDFALLNFKVGLFIMLLFGISGIFDHFLLLRQMRPLNTKSIKNSPVSQDPILGDPANLTILAVLSNCQKADFVFLRKMAHLEETEFYRRITGLQQAGLVLIHEMYMGPKKTIRNVSITPLGWQIINQIYNEVGSNTAPPQALVHA